MIHRVPPSNHHILPHHWMEQEQTLLELLWALDGIECHSVHHPEQDVLYHSLQVFQHALASTDDPILWSAALFHDVGKAYAFHNHAELGRQCIESIFVHRITWLVAHHMDLLHRPKRTQRRWAGQPQLHELQQLRKWDLAGRSPNADVMEPEDAVSILIQHPEIFATH